MVKIERYLNPRDEGKPIVTHLKPDDRPEEERLRDLSIAVDEFDTRLEAVRLEMLDACWNPGDPDAPYPLDLNTGLPRTLWTAVLHRTFKDSYSGPEDEFAVELEGRNDVWLRWGFSEGPDGQLDDDRLLVFLGVGGEQLAEAGWDDFVIESNWASMGLRWMIGELGSGPRDIKQVIRKMPGK